MDLQSLNMNTLASSLPPSNLANAEKDLMDKFKAAALSITTLYRSSRATSKKAYNAGYAAACQDLLLMIQQGVSDSQMQEGLDGEPGAGMGMTIGRVMDWVEARLEAVKAREEEEDEEEERSRPGVPEGSHSNRAGTSGRDALSSGVNGSKSTSRPSFQPKEQTRLATSAPFVPATPQTPGHSTPDLTWRVASSATPSPASSRIRLPETPQVTPVPLGASNINAKIRMLSHMNNKTVSTSSPTVTSLSPSTSFDFASGAHSFRSTPVHDTALLSPLEITPPVAAGAKRRHDMMMMLNNAGENSALTAEAQDREALAAGPASGTRRRTRSMRDRERDGNDMDVDDRERKRVARR